MKKRIENIKRNAKDEGMKTLMVVLGAITGTLAAKGIRKITESKPQLSAIANYATPLLLGGGGFILAAGTEKTEEKIKYFGYGLTVAGTYEGIKLIPVVKDILNGVLGNTEIPAANAFYTESEERGRIMEGFGLAALPVGSTVLQDATGYETNLPQLDETNTYQGTGNLGFNPSATDDVDLSGIV